jgi:hypothetical protein
LVRSFYSSISSLQGLIKVMKLERYRQPMMYLDLMNNSLTKQDQYIRDIIDYSRNKRKQDLSNNQSLNTLIKMDRSKSVCKDSSKIEITALSVDLVNTDELRLQIINNFYLMQ